MQDLQAQPQSQPDSQASEAQDNQVRDGVGKSQEVAAQSVARHNADREARQKAIIESARAALKAEFRQTQGIPAPLTETPATQAVTQAATPAATLAAPQAAPTGNALAEAFTAQLNAQFQQAQQARAEAAQIAAEAQAKAAEAEAKLQTFINNPAAYMQQQGLNLDQWQQRLLNGGEPTEAERLRAEIRAELKAEMAPVLNQVNQVSQHLHAEAKTRALNDLTPILAKEFPLLNVMSSPDALLTELRVEAQKAHAAGTYNENFAKNYLANKETQILAQQKTWLQNPNVATKLGLSVQSPHAVVADQSPQTLSNRVTSTVASAPTRAMSDRDRIAQGRALIRKLGAAGSL